MKKSLINKKEVITIEGFELPLKFDYVNVKQAVLEFKHYLDDFGIIDKKRLEDCGVFDKYKEIFGDFENER